MPMPDEFDRASDNEQVQRDAAVAAVLRPKLPYITFDGLNCVDCKTEIPAARLALKCIRCIYCQQIVERQLTYKYKLPSV